ncbi:hypothetical protein BO82DRAFT_369805 [Aspergillus uvarum CBS 121591]|uniref:BZIP domain-containing protein n=1 Tax=Aspergillus uvarum CBS 121591 TaxID=1448315 RepID=A0A319BQZ1_9EURO|nr:hypothetical protein BO82DRAFT_369805 [Aspergillus uvarum CBS 121591]PYH75926.1 hypothetical protein BO82DRAFT_369805 [Aspergillus uvarum CBS 121591]
MNPNFSRYSRNSHVRNGQPTPPPYDENRRNKRKLSEIDVEYSMQQYQPQLQQQQQPQQQAQRLSQQLPSPPHDEEQAKRDRFLERNRIAASKCRQKKKKLNEQLERQFLELQAKNTELSTEVEDLRAEVIAMKNELLRHSECGDPAIALHLSQMVQNITARDHAAADRRSAEISELLMMGDHAAATTGTRVSVSSLTNSPPGLSTSRSVSSSGSSGLSPDAAAAAAAFGFDSPPLNIMPFANGSVGNSNDTNSSIKTAMDASLDTMPGYEFLEDLALMD